MDNEYLHYLKTYKLKSEDLNRFSIELLEKEVPEKPIHSGNSGKQCPCVSLQ